MHAALPSLMSSDEIPEKQCNNVRAPNNKHEDLFNTASCNNSICFLKEVQKPCLLLVDHGEKKVFFQKKAGNTLFSRQKHALT